MSEEKQQETTAGGRDATPRHRQRSIRGIVPHFWMPFLASLARGQQPSQHLAKLRHRTVDSTLHSTFARPQHPCQTLPPRPGQHPAHHDQRRALLRHSIWDNTLRSTFAKLRHHALDSTLHSTFARLRHRTLNSSLRSTLWSRRLKSSPPKT